VKDVIYPSDMVGHHFLVTTQTPEGPYQRLVRAFDESDAIEQVLAYLSSEGISHGDVTTRKF